MIILFATCLRFPGCCHALELYLATDVLLNVHLHHKRKLLEHTAVLSLARYSSTGVCGLPPWAIVLSSLFSPFVATVRVEPSRRFHSCLSYTLGRLFLHSCFADIVYGVFFWDGIYVGTVNYPLRLRPVRTGPIPRNFQGYTW